MPKGEKQQERLHELARSLKDLHLAGSMEEALKRAKDKLEAAGDGYVMAKGHKLDAATLKEFEFIYEDFQRLADRIGNDPEQIIEEVKEYARQRR